jgi:hypothetical protein
MKRLTCTLLVMFLSSLSPLGAQSPQQPTDADFDWVWRFQKQALDALMPLDLKPRQIVSYRSDHDLQRIGDIESHFTITYAAGAAYDTMNRTGFPEEPTVREDGRHGNGEPVFT